MPAFRRFSAPAGLAALVLAAVASPAADWPQFRGPAGSGLAPGSRAALERVHETNSPPTPRADDAGVVACFGSFGLLAYGPDGQEQWRRPLPTPRSLHGSASSPLLDRGLVLAAANPAVGADPGTHLSWDHREAVRYQENHDPSMIWLADGRQLRVHYGKAGWKQVATWKKGRALTLRYTAAEGLLLVDDATGGRLQVLGGMPHPLDGLLDKHLERAESTMGMAECYRQAARQWELEMNRNLKELRAALPREESRAVQEAQEAWLKFREQERKAIRAINGREGTGTISIIQAAGAHLRVTRDRALCLQQYLADVW